MKQIERVKTITYRWWRNDGKNIQSLHVKTLEEIANNHISAMIADGFTSGDLHDTLNNAVDYSGYWEATTTETYQ